MEEVFSSLNIILKDKKLKSKVDVEDIVRNPIANVLLQCLMNLLSKAIKFTENGSLEITAKLLIIM